MKTKAQLGQVSPGCNVGGSDLDEIVAKIMNKKTPSEFEKVKDSVQIPKRDLLEEQDRIALVRKYHMALQNVKISEDMRKFFINPPKNE